MSDMMQGRKCAFLRGVNVNGRKVIMKDVCDIFAKEGMKDVSSVLATGNILFRSPLKNAELRTMLESALSSHYSNKFELFIKDIRELEAIIENDPFDSFGEFHTYVFISEKGEEVEFERLFKGIVPAPNEEGVVNKGTFYWKVTKGDTLTSGFSKMIGRKDFKDKFTSRNINTLERIMKCED